jgi:putative hydrolase of the HAD superfamily
VGYARSVPDRWILFDVGGVLELVDDASWPITFVARCAQRLGISVEEFEARLATVRLPDAGTRSGVEDEFWRVYGTAVGADPGQLQAIRDDFWDAYCGQANAELIEFARSLVGRVGLAILSNSADGAREQEERRFGFSAVFDPICYSHEIGVNKPDERAFRAALDRMGAKPDSVIFVDNRAENVEAARKLGLVALLHVGNRTTIEAITRLLAGLPADQPEHDGNPV